ncbi:prepilin-type N-terminal cleavage/methylation domain-containing protein [Candidatus Gottesmanbacteria bacterium]|nr:prepilin-type N-terminal cleavage/methylation domain-containing protein [Candidatus Gottesmanbacteria bacterium]
MNTAHLKKGFTLIELLIVIALLGALAVGLLATIDPFEQLKKGRDTSLRNTTAEFYNANLRYYATKGNFPWGTSSSFTASGVDTMGSYVTDLINAGELKNRFMDLAGTGNLAKVLVTSTAPEHMAVCFKPESKSFQIDTNTTYSTDGAVVSSGCKSQTSTGGTDCYFCVQ